MKIEIKEFKRLGFCISEVEEYLSEETQKCYIRDCMTNFYLGEKNAKTEMDWLTLNVHINKENEKISYSSKVLINKTEAWIVGWCNEKEGLFELTTLDIRKDDTEKTNKVEKNEKVEEEEIKVIPNKPVEHPNQILIKYFSYLIDSKYITLKNRNRIWFRVYDKVDEAKKNTKIGFFLYKGKAFQYQEMNVPNTCEGSQSELAVKAIALNKSSSGRNLDQDVLKALEDLKEEDITGYILNKLESEKGDVMKFAEVLYLLNIPMFDKCLYDWDKSSAAYTDGIKEEDAFRKKHGLNYGWRIEENN